MRDMSSLTYPHSYTCKAFPPIIGHETNFCLQILAMAILYCSIIGSSSLQASAAPMGYHLAVLLVCVDTIIPYFRTTTSSKHQGTIYWNHCQATTHQHTTIHQVPFHTEFHTISKILTNLLITFHVAINITISDSVQKLNLTILCNSEFCIHRYSI